jgi:hypothetical protein
VDQPHIGLPPHALDDLGGHADGLGQEQRRSLITAILVDQYRQAVGQVVPGAGPGAVDDIRRLVHGQLVDGQALLDRLEGEHRARVVPENARLPARVADHRGEVFDLAIDRAGGAVPAVAAAAPVVGHRGEVRGEHRRQPGDAGPVVERTADQDHRRAAARPLQGDRGAVGPSHGLEGGSHRFTSCGWETGAQGRAVRQRCGLTASRWPAQY